MSDTTAKRPPMEVRRRPRRLRDAIRPIEKDATTRCQLPAEGELILGRADDSDIRLQDRVASRHHAKLLVTLQEVERSIHIAKTVRLVNGGADFARRTLSNGDVLQICKASLFYCAELRPHRTDPPARAASCSVASIRARARPQLRRSLSLLCLVPVLSEISRADFQVAWQGSIPFRVLLVICRDSNRLWAQKLQG